MAKQQDTLYSIRKNYDKDMAGGVGAKKDASTGPGGLVLRSDAQLDKTLMIVAQHLAATAVADFAFILVSSQTVEIVALEFDRWLRLHRSDKPADGWTPAPLKALQLSERLFRRRGRRPMARVVGYAMPEVLAHGQRDSGR